MKQSAGHALEYFSQKSLSTFYNGYHLCFQKHWEIGHSRQNYCIIDMGTILTRGLGGGGTLGIFGWLCVAGTLEPVAYTRASSAEFATLYYTKLPNLPYPRVAFSSF